MVEWWSWCGCVPVVVVAMTDVMEDEVVALVVLAMVWSRGAGGCDRGNCGGCPSLSRITPIWFVSVRLSHVDYFYIKINGAIHTICSVYRLCDKRNV